MDLIIHSVRALYCFPPAIREPNFSLNIDRSWPDGYDYTIYACTLFMLVLLLDKQKYNYLEDLEKKTRTVNDAIIQIVNTDLILRGYITTICSLLDNRTLHQDLRKHVGSFTNICWCWRTIFAEIVLSVHLVESQQSGLLSIKEAGKFYMYIEYFQSLSSFLWKLNQ